MRVGSAKGALGASRSGWLVGPSEDFSLSERPKPKRRLIGLIGGTGGGTCGSDPFFNDAPAGKLTVSMTDVVERKTGSEISDLAIDFLRNMPCRIGGCAAVALKAAAFGVVGFEVGGVGVAENGGTGDVCGWKP